MARTTEEQLRAAHVKTPTVLDGTILLAEYDETWPTEFSQKSDDLMDCLGDQTVQLEHVGSTSVPGLAAKPIIDMVLVVPDSTLEADYVPPLGTLGYVLHIREPDWFEHRLLKPPSKDVNLHVFSRGCTEVDRMIAFRDWLRGNDEDRMLYERTKRDLAARTWKYTQHYADAKSEVVKDIMSRAYPTTEHA